MMDTVQPKDHEVFVEHLIERINNTDEITVIGETHYCLSGRYLLVEVLPSGPGHPFQGSSHPAYEVHHLGQSIAKISEQSEAVRIYEALKQKLDLQKAASRYKM